MLEFLLDADKDVMVFLNNLGLEKYDFFWATVTQIVVWIPLYLLFALLIYITYKHQRPVFHVLMTFVMLLISIGLNQLVKSTVRRLRPSNTEGLSELLRVLVDSHSYSFYSGHAANSFALTTFVVLLIRKKYSWAPWFFLWPLCFSFSRIYVGVHYPSDILAGAFIGTLFAILCFKLYRHFENKKQAEVI